MFDISRLKYAWNTFLSGNQWKLRVLLPCLVIIQCFPERTFSQGSSNTRVKDIVIESDTTSIDSLSIATGSVIMRRQDGSLVEDSQYSIDETSGRLISKKLRGAVSIRYKVFPYTFNKPYFHKDREKLTSFRGLDTLKLYRVEQARGDINEGATLHTNGSISRGISVGNNQDVIMNSHMNLQIQGNITEKIKIEGSISDNNIPVQPEGNSQQIQDFDKIYLKAYSERTECTFGDYEIVSSQESFLKYHKKAQGVEAKNRSNQKNNELKTQGAIALSKGKYSRKTIQGIEGNQGPYRLTGNDNELYIVVLSGTEKVYMDGKLRTRGEDYDYVIDYNTAEITFTPFLPINKFSRIAVEFEYSDKNYARFLVVSNNSLTSKRARTWVNIYAEQDNKNQQLQQVLNEDQKKALARAGNFPALYETIKPDTSGNQNIIRYKRRDTIVGALEYKNILVLSSDEQTELYTATFSFVGKNKGNYVIWHGKNNGRTFKWVAPQAHRQMGDYEPVIILVAPKKKQVIVTGNELNITKRTRTFVETAVSNNDANTFSTHNDTFNKGFGMKMGVEHTIPLGSNKNTLVTTLSQTIIDKTFDPVDSYKPVEFERDWNLGQGIKANEYLSSGRCMVQSNHGNMGYSIELLRRDRGYKAYKHGVQEDIRYQSWRLRGNASMTRTFDTVHTTSFDRYKATLSKDFRRNTVGAETEEELNIWKKRNGFISTSSSHFITYKLFATREDSSSWNYLASIERRTNYAVDTITSILEEQSRSYDWTSQLGLVQDPDNTLKIYGHYRYIAPVNKKTHQQPEKNMTGRVEHQLGLMKRMLTFNTFYELGSGQENKKAYSFVEVTEGQGVYMWEEATDYNHNGLPELDEFEIAKYKFQAKYVKVFIPTNEYISTFSNQFGEIMNVEPRRLIQQTSTAAKVLSLVSTSTSLKSSFKTTNEDFLKNTVPLLDAPPDTSMVHVNASFRQTIYINRSGRKFNTQYSYSSEKTKMITTNGWEMRQHHSHQTFTRIDLTRWLTLFITQATGIKKSGTEALFLENKNHDITYYEEEPKLSYQPTPHVVIDISYNNLNQKNINGEKSLQHTIGIENKISSSKLGQLTTTCKYLRIQYNRDANTALSYFMLDGLKPGNNYTWDMTYQREIGKRLQLSINYQGQKPQGTRTLHTGTMQLSAYF